MSIIISTVWYTLKKASGIKTPGAFIFLANLLILLITFDFDLKMAYIILTRVIALNSSATNSPQAIFRIHTGKNFKSKQESTFELDQCQQYYPFAELFSIAIIGIVCFHQRNNWYSLLRSC